MGTLVPNADGTYDEATGTAPHWDQIDDDPADEITYLTLTPPDVGDKRQYSALFTAYAASEANKRPNHITVRMACRQQTSTGYRARAFLRIDGVNYYHALVQAPLVGTTFGNLLWQWAQNPMTSEEWEDTDLDNLEVCLEIEKTSLSDSGGVDFSNMVVDYTEEAAGPLIWSTDNSSFPEYGWPADIQKIGTLSNVPVKPGTVTFTSGGKVLTDVVTQNGRLSGDGDGLIDYSTGRFVLAFDVKPDPGTQVFCSWVPMEGKCDFCKTNKIQLFLTPGPAPWGLQGRPEINQSEAYNKFLEKLETVIPIHVEWLWVPVARSSLADFGNRFDVYPADLLLWKRNEAFGTGNAIETNFSSSSRFRPIIENTLTITAQGVTIPLTVTDDGAGNLTGNGSGTVNYATGLIDCTFSEAPDSGEAVLISYKRGTLEDGLKAEVSVLIEVVP